MDKIVMIEAGANEVDEDTMLNAIKAAHVEIKKIITFINGLSLIHISVADVDAIEVAHGNSSAALMFQRQRRQR